MGFVTLTGPVSAPSGTTTFSDIAVGADGTAVAPPVNVTSVALAMFVPVTVMSVSTTAAAGAKLVARGGCTTVSVAALVADPSAVVTVILPVTAPTGTGNVSCVPLDAIEASGTPNAPIFTPGVVTPTFRLNPLTVITVALPPTALSGVTSVIFGSTLNAVALPPLPARFVTLTGPVSAPDGTTTCNDVAVTAVGTAVGPPVNVTSEEPVRAMPPIVMVAPTVAAAG